MMLEWFSKLLSSRHKVVAHQLTFPLDVDGNVLNEIDAVEMLMDVELDSSDHEEFTLTGILKAGDTGTVVALNSSNEVCVEFYRDNKWALVNIGSSKVRLAPRMEEIPHHA